MPDFIHEKFNRRALARVPADLRAVYYIKKQSHRYQECTIINISRSGAAIKFPEQEQLRRGAVVFIDVILPRNFRKLMLQGEITTIRLKGHEHIGAVKFKELLDEETFSNLT